MIEFSKTCFYQNSISENFEKIRKFLFFVLFYNVPAAKKSEKKNKGQNRTEGRLKLEK